MGATSWHYYTPHTEDPEEALQRLRAEVFARGDYVDLTGSVEDMLRNTYRRFGEDPDSPAVQPGLIIVSGCSGPRKPATSPD